MIEKQTIEQPMQEYPLWMKILIHRGSLYFLIVLSSEFQGAASTIAGISVLYTVNAYIILTFFKTVWLTMVIGLLHGLLFIPTTLSFLPVS